MSVRRAWIAVAALAALAGCIKAPTPTYARSFTDNEITYAGYAASFHAVEPSILASLGEQDSRIFSRMAPKPTRDELSGDLHGLRAQWRHRGYIDPLLFTDRQESLQTARSDFSAVELREDLRFDAAGRFESQARMLAIDQELVRRLITEEDARLAVERDSPRAALTLVRAMVDGWPVDPFLADDAMDKTVAWRLSDLRKGLAPGSFSEAERDTIRIDLAALVSKMARTPQARNEAFLFNDAMLSIWTTPYAIEDQTALEESVRTFVDARAHADAFEPTFDRARDSLKGQIDAAMSVLSESHRASVRADAKALLLTPPPCAARLPVRTARDMAPPPERALACSLVRTLAAASTDEAEVTTLIALYDATTIADWALSLHGSLRDPTRAADRRLTISALSTDERAMFLREASARPDGFIAAGLAASVLVDRGAGFVRARAASWRAFGETPIDVAAVILIDRK